MKVKHFLLMGIFLIGLLYIAHMLASHNAGGILSGVGVNVA